MADVRGGSEVQLRAYDGAAFDHVRFLDYFKTAIAAPDVGLLAAIAPDRRFTSVNLGATIGNTQAWDCNGADTAMLYIGTTQTGTFLIEVSADGTNYISAEAADVTTDLWVSGVNLTPTAQKVYRIMTNGYRSVRVRTITTLGAVVACIMTLSSSSVLIAAIDRGPAPHNFGYTPINKVVQTTTTQTGSDVWTPASGKKICVTSYQIQAGGTVGGTVQVWFGANADTTYSRGTDLTIFDGEFAPSATLKPGVVQSGVWACQTVDHEVHLTTSAAINPLTINLWGYEY